MSEEKERPTDLLAHKLDTMIDLLKDVKDLISGFYKELIIWLVKTLVLALVALALGSKTVDIVQKWADKTPFTAVAEGR